MGIGAVGSLASGARAAGSAMAAAAAAGGAGMAGGGQTAFNALSDGGKRMVGALATEFRQRYQGFKDQQA